MASTYRTLWVLSGWPRSGSWSSTDPEVPFSWGYEWYCAWERASGIQSYNQNWIKVCARVCVRHTVLESELCIFTCFYFFSKVGHLWSICRIDEGGLAWTSIRKALDGKVKTALLLSFAFHTFFNRYYIYPACSSMAYVWAHSKTKRKDTLEKIMFQYGIYSTQ